MTLAARVWLGLAAALLLGGCLPDGSIDEMRMRDGGDGVDWAGPGGTYGEQHYSPLDDINDSNAGELGLVWSIDLPPGLSATAPLAVQGVVYFVAGQSVVRAADAATGKLLWTFDPEVWRHAGRKLRGGWGTRGIAWWHGRIFVGTMDGRLIAIDARTGKQAWSVQTLPEDDPTFITGAPRVFDGKVIIGFGGADFGPVRGYVSTYEAETGRLLWRWHTVPGDPAKGFEDPSQEMAAKTWSGEWWKLGGGGTAWNSFSYDPETRFVFVGVGNGSPWNHKARSQGRGDNLFLASVVALDADTGAYKWHYQVNPGETWDFGATMDMQFATLDIGGKPRKVLMTAPKNGFFYVIDRTNGKLISAEPFARVNWASRIDVATGRPVENPAARYPQGTTFAMWPSGNGAHNWYPMAFSPRTRLAYIPVLERSMTWADYGVEGGAWRQTAPVGTVQAATMNSLPDLPGDPLNRTSRLEAWDPVTQKRVWSQSTPGTESGGIMATGGNLVFQGQLDGAFSAYAADSGKRLWSFQTHAPVLAPPISYSAGGRQYVTVLTGIGGHTAFTGFDHAAFNTDYRTMPRRALTFALGGKATLPLPAARQTGPPADPAYRADAARAARGIVTFGMHCSTCHGFYAISGGSGPDLRMSGITYDAAQFRQVVKQGALLPQGMPRFDELSDAAIEDARHYIRVEAAKAR